MTLGSQGSIQRPYAEKAAQDSVGKLLGILHLRLLGDILCWEAKGEAKKLFDNGLHETILNYLKDHSDKAQETVEHFAIKLFMVGKRASRAMPMIMLVSDDKDARRQAFGSISESDIMAKYPGFGLNHSSFKKFLDWNDEQISVFWTQHEDASNCCQLTIHSPSNPEQPIRLAVAGGAVSYKGKYMLLTANHFLKGRRRVESQAQRAEGSPIPDFETTLNFDDDDSEMAWDFSDDEDDDADGGDDNNNDTGPDSIERTRQGSVSDAEESEGSDIDDSDGPASPAASDTAPLRIPPPMRTRQLIGKGKPVLSVYEYDYALIEVESDSSLPSPLFDNAIPLDALDQIESRLPGDGDVDVITVTPNGGIVHGVIESRSILKCAHSKEYFSAYEMSFSGRMGPGDSGSWVRDAASGRLFGHVVAGISDWGLATIIPAKFVFKHARARLDEQAALAT